MKMIIYQQGSMDQNQISSNNHINDLSKVLMNLLPLCSDDYAYIKNDVTSSTFDSTKHYIATTDEYGNMEFTLPSSYDSTKTYYIKDEDYITKNILNILLEYLKENEIDDYTIENFYKLIACSSNEAFTNLLSQIYSNNPENLKTIYILLMEAMAKFDNGYLYIADFIDKYHTLGLTNSDTLITAAYIAADYENQYQQSISSDNKSLLLPSPI